MAVYLSLHGVSRMALRADGHALVAGESAMHWWQVLALYDREGMLIGEITLHLTNPEAALPMGEQPPYWGMPTPVGALVRLTPDGELESPF